MNENASDDGTVGQPAPGLEDAEFPAANMNAARAIAGALASTLGPTPRDKLVVTALEARQEPDPSDPPRDVYLVATDGAAILDELPLEHPIGPLLRRMIGPERPGDTDVEGQDIPDGVTTSVVLLASLLDEASELIEMGVHPADVKHGYRAALDVATETLADLATPLSLEDRERAEAVARSAMNGNDIGGLLDTWAPLAVDAVEQVGHPNAKTFAIRTKRTGSLSDSRLIDGTVLDRSGRADDRMPESATDASVLVLGGHGTGGLTDPSLERDFSTADDGDVDPSGLATAFDGRREEVITDIVTSGADVVLARQGMETEYRAALAEHDILGIRGVNRLKLAQAALATGATIVNDITDIRPEHLGHAGRVSVQAHDPRPNRRRTRKMTVIEGCADPGSVTALLAGTFDQGGEQLTRQLRKAAAAVAGAAGHETPHGGYLPGGGAVDAVVARRVREAATEQGTKAQLAVERFADAVEMIPFTIAKNAGDDPVGVVADIRAEQSTGELAYGYTAPDRTVTNVVDAGVLDTHHIRRRTYTKATEVANLILGIDDAVKANFEFERPDPDEKIYDQRARDVESARENDE
ncbi:TCP-1/cpn60 chaperonin family protein [Halorientalis pallida]|uniref:Thermosome n=1 Tax=Halorientalis pallida TaxID=2479928 RepID=A0A498KUK2_9EURY|nr:TCP-1/cpn60 chaperonin family protein [Halorientalis pallida]RXK47924.1 thermosome [Halorientalis pallida]